METRFALIFNSSHAILNHGMFRIRFVPLPEDILILVLDIFLKLDAVNNV